MCTDGQICGVRKKTTIRSFSALLVLIITFSLFHTYAKADQVDLIVTNLWGYVGIFSTSGAITLKDGTTPGYTNIYSDNDLDTPLDVPGLPPATGAGYDLSNYEIWGAGNTSSSRESGEITMLGGKVKCICGAGPWGVYGDSIILVMGGTIIGSVWTGPRFSASSDYNGGKSKLEISGGYIGGNARSGGVFSLAWARDDCEILISGGTICGDVKISHIASWASREIVITGGTILGSVGFPNPSNADYTTTIPTNGISTVYKTVLTIPNITSPTSLEDTLVLTGAAFNYGVNDITTTSDGHLTLYLSEGTSYANYLKTYFQADVTLTKDPNNAFVEIAPPPNANDGLTEIPKTGDPTPLCALVILAILCLLGLLLINHKYQFKRRH